MTRKAFKIMVFTIFTICSVQPGIAADRMPVFVSIAPQKYFVQEIGKDLVDVQLMVQPGADPHTYEPKPRQMVAISKAKLYFAIGVEFEVAYLDKIIAINPQIKLVRTDQGIEKIPMTAHHHGEEEHHDKEAGHHKEGEHEHDGRPDPHIWLSPPLVMIQARTILKALQETDPSHAAAYEANYNAFVSDLTKLDTDLKQIFSGKNGGLRFMAFHPSWGYFARAYGLKQVAIETEGKAPKPAQLKELIRHARESDISVIFVQPQFSSKSAKLLAKEISGEVAFVDPLAENWSANLREVASKFRAALK